MNKRSPFYQESFYQKGPVFFMKASAAENNLANEQASFYSTLQQDYSQRFAGQSDILDQLKSTFGPIVAAGPGQKGFTPAEEAALRTGASDSVATSYNNAQKAISSQEAARGGGNAFLPSGVDEQINAGLAASAARTNAENQNQITQENYKLGLTNFYNAASELSGNAGMMNPNAYASNANSAGNSAFSSAYQIQQQNSGWINTVAGILGGAMSAAGTAAAGGAFG